MRGEVEEQTSRERERGREGESEKARAKDKLRRLWLPVKPCPPLAFTNQLPSTPHSLACLAFNSKHSCDL
jgi:hypothetical protein